MNLFERQPKNKLSLFKRKSSKSFKLADFNLVNFFPNETADIIYWVQFFEFAITSLENDQSAFNSIKMHCVDLFRYCPLENVLRCILRQKVILVLNQLTSTISRAKQQTLFSELISVLSKWMTFQELYQLFSNCPCVRIVREFAPILIESFIKKPTKESFFQLISLSKNKKNQIVFTFPKKMTLTDDFQKTVFPILRNNVQHARFLQDFFLIFSILHVPLVNELVKIILESKLNFGLFSDCFFEKVYEDIFEDYRTSRFEIIEEKLKTTQEYQILLQILKMIDVTKKNEIYSLIQRNNIHFINCKMAKSYLKAKDCLYVPSVLLKNDAFNPTCVNLGELQQNQVIHLQDFQLSKENVIWVKSEEITKISLKLLKNKVVAIDVKQCKNGYNVFEAYKLALIQIYDGTSIYIFDCIAFKFNDEFKKFIIELLKKSQIIKVGVDLNKVVQLVHTSFELSTGIDVDFFIDLFEIKNGTETINFKLLCEDFFKKNLCFLEQVSSWEKRPLRSAQIHMASLLPVLYFKMFVYFLKDDLSDTWISIIFDLNLKVQEFYKNKREMMADIKANQLEEKNETHKMANNIEDAKSRSGKNRLENSFQVNGKTNTTFETTQNISSLAPTESSINSSVAQPNIIILKPIIKKIPKFNGQLTLDKNNLEQKSVFINHFPKENGANVEHEMSTEVPSENPIIEKYLIHQKPTEIDDNSLINVDLCVNELFSDEVKTRLFEKQVENNNKSQELNKKILNESKSDDNGNIRVDSEDLKPNEKRDDGVKMQNVNGVLQNENNRSKKRVVFASNLEQPSKDYPAWKISKLQLDKKEKKRRNKLQKQNQFLQGDYFQMNQIDISAPTFDEYCAKLNAPKNNIRETKTQMNASVIPKKVYFVGNQSSEQTDKISPVKSTFSQHPVQNPSSFSSFFQSSSLYPLGSHPPRNFFQDSSMPQYEQSCPYFRWTINPHSDQQADNDKIQSSKFAQARHYWIKFGKHRNLKKN